MGDGEEFLTRDRLLGHFKKHASHRGVITIVILALLFDIAFLNYKILSLNPPIINQSSNSVRDQGLTSSGDASCSEACINEINSAISSSQTIQQPSYPSQLSANVKEFYVPFGSGVNSSDDWQDVPGLQAYIDRSAYGSINKVTFEASVRVPTGNQTADVRLFNVTAGHPVWYSEMMFTGGGSPQLLISGPITLDAGNNLYKVQMKTQLKYPAYLDQARVHILTF
jgi:hypothetical protein